MSCEKMKLLMMDALYEEISPEEASVLKAHLKTCDRCRADLSALQLTEQKMAEWPEMESNLKLVFVSEQGSLLDRVMDGMRSWRLPRLNFAAGLAVAAMVFFVLLAMFNTRLAYEGGRFQLQFSLTAKSVDLPPDGVVMTQKQWDDFQHAQLLQMEEIIQRSESRQRLELGQALIGMAKKIDYDRGRDLRMVEQGLKQIDYQTAIKFAETDRLLNGVMHYALQEQNAAPRQ